MGYLVRRLEFFVVTLWAALTLNFILPRLLPGGPEVALLTRFHGRIQPATIKSLEAALGIRNDQSPIQQYLSYMGNRLRGDFGVGLGFYPQRVSHVIMLALPWTLGLVGTATLIAFLLGTLIGILGAWRRGGILDSILPPIFVITSAFPYFWLAMLSIWLFAIKFHWLPQSGGYDFTTTVGWTWAFIGDALKHSILPAATILVTSIGGWILTMRNNTITVLIEDDVRMARAKGLSPWRVMWSYAGTDGILPTR